MHRRVLVNPLTIISQSDCNLGLQASLGDMPDTDENQSIQAELSTAVRERFATALCKFLCHDAG